MVLGATLMHWGVPFRRTTRRGLTEQQQATVDETSEKLINLRERYQRSQAQGAQEVSLSDEEVTLLITIIEDCLQECGSDLIELNLQLKTRERNEIEAVLERLRVSLGTRFAKLA
jgi:hypothetical protein